VGGVLARLRTPAGAVPVTMDNWLLDGAGLLPRIHNCAKLQVDVGERGPTLVTEHDLDPAVVHDLTVVHRNLTYLERVTDSNERELLGAIELLTTCLDMLRNRRLTLHFDNLNAAVICEKGSPKFRLHAYALRIADLCLKHNIQFKPIWIPRCLNHAADQISKMLDYEDYTVTDTIFQYIQQLTGFIPNFDRFANNWNAKCANFNSAVYCLGSVGVDAFAYSWGPPTLNWIFPPPRLVARAVLHLERSKGRGVLLSPLWKGAAFYPVLMDFDHSPFLKNKWILPGKNVFRRGADATSCFGPDFTGMVEVRLFDFNL